MLLAALLAPSALLAKGPVPDQVISLESLGFQSVTPRYLLAGGTMLTLDYVDNTHLLVTFGVPRLMRRLSECQPEDQDRVVDAVLLELPSGRELARAEWRFHDISQYLWPLGHGHFLLRQRNVLTTFAPLTQLASGDTFAQHPFLHFDNDIDAIYVSPDRDLLTIESSKHTPKAEPQLTAVSRPAPPVAAPPPIALGPGQSTPALSLRRRSSSSASADPALTSPEARVHISFIRLLAPGTPDAPLIAQHAGSFEARRPLMVPLTAEGFLRTRDSSSAGVTLDFVTYAGKVADLGSFETSCPPTPIFLTHSEFVAFGCRGSSDRLTLAGFNVHGDLLWKLLFSDSEAYHSFAAANSAGRFALSRTLTTSTIVGDSIAGGSPTSSELTAQEVRVLQNYNGKQLLRVNTSPIQLSGQNFALSPDGLSLAVIRDPVDRLLKEVQHKPAIEIYKLPPLSDEDRKQLGVESAFAPEPSQLPIRFTAVAAQSTLIAARDASDTPPQMDADPADVPSAPPAPATSADDSRPHFTPHAAPATTEEKAAEQPTEQPATGEQPEHRPRPTLYDPTYDGTPENSGNSAAPAPSAPPQLKR
jgi:hypothetical protein